LQIITNLTLNEIYGNSPYEIGNFGNTDLLLIVDRLRNDLYCVGWGVKLYSLTHCL